MGVRVERMRKVLQEESRKEWEWYVKEIGRQEIVNVQANIIQFLIKIVFLVIFKSIRKALS